MNLHRFPLPAHTSSVFSPLSCLSAFQHEVNRLFDLPSSSRHLDGPGEWSLALDLYQDKDTLLVTVEVPGLKKEDINLSLHGDLLTLSGERRHVASHNSKGAVHNERHFGRFERTVTLPVQIDGTRVSASYKAGVLTITLPKAEAAKLRQIEIGVS